MPPGADTVRRLSTGMCQIAIGCRRHTNASVRSLKEPARDSVLTAGPGVVTSMSLADQLPKRFGVRRGFAIALDGAVSQQADVLVIDHLNNAPIHPKYSVDTNSEDTRWPGTGGGGACSTPWTRATCPARTSLRRLRSQDSTADLSARRAPVPSCRHFADGPGLLGFSLRTSAIWFVFISPAVLGRTADATRPLLPFSVAGHAHAHHDGHLRRRQLGLLPDLARRYQRVNNGRALALRANRARCAPRDVPSKCLEADDRRRPVPSWHRG